MERCVAAVGARQDSFGTDFDGRYSFDTFVTGDWNRLAHSAATTVAEQPGGAYNPLFIHSPSGLGKTHLIKAIGRSLLQRRQARVVYATSERIINEFVNCILSKRMGDFRDKYRQCDVLIIDDVQFLAPEHDKTQNEIFQLFNALHSARRQVILAADVRPGDLSGLEARLKSRFDWGLTVDIQPPSVAERQEVVARKAAVHGLNLSGDVAHYLADSCRGTIRQIESAILTLVARRDFEGVEITLDVAKKAVPRHASVLTPLETYKLIARTTAAAYGVSAADLTGKTRKRTVVQARHVVSYLSRKYAKLSLAEIGRLSGGRDHTTVVHAIRQIESGLRDDGDLRAVVARLEQKLN